MAKLRSIIPSRLSLFYPFLLILVGTLVYLNSFNGVFVFDDETFIVNALELRTLVPFWEPMFAGIHYHRPLTGLSFAVNYAISGLEIWSYHLLSLAIHLIAGLALFGLISLTLKKTRFREEAGVLALVTALIWLVHPLQTESVTYITQRYESLMGMFFLLSVLCYTVSTRSEHRQRLWQAGSILFCYLAVGSKQVAVVIPVIVFLYDKIFITRSFKQTLLTRWRFLLLLISSWIPLFYLLKTAKPFEWAGFSMEVVTPWKFAISQFGVVVHYLKLAFWPDPLVLDYFWQFASTPGEVVPYALMIAILVIFSLWGVFKNHPFGFLGLSFFIILSPSSSIMPISDLAAEHRMYLPLAPLVTGVVIAIYHLCRKIPLLLDKGEDSQAVDRTGVIAFTVFSLVAIVIFGTATYERNKLYSSRVAIWKDTAEKAPHNPRALANYGSALIEEKKYEEALVVLQKALELRPDYSVVLINLGYLSNLKNDVEKTIHYWKRALEARPHERTYYNLAMIYLLRGHKKEAIRYFEGAVNTKPGWPPATIQLARLYAVDGSVSTELKKKALALATEANRLKNQPNPFYQDTLASACAANLQFPQAVTAQQNAIRLAAPLNNNQLTQVLQYRLRLYQNNQPYSEPDHLLDITVRYPR